MYSSNSAKKGIASRVARCKMKLPYSKNFIKVGSNTSNENYIAIRQGNVSNMSACSGVYFTKNRISSTKMFRDK